MVIFLGNKLTGVIKMNKVKGIINNDFTVSVSNDETFQLSLLSDSSVSPFSSYYVEGFINDKGQFVAEKNIINI
jgi:hypothetical protein